MTPTQIPHLDALAVQLPSGLDAGAHSLMEGMSK